MWAILSRPRGAALVLRAQRQGAPPRAPAEITSAVTWRFHVGREVARRSLANTSAHNVKHATMAPAKEMKMTTAARTGQRSTEELETLRTRNRNMSLWFLSMAVAVLGVSYASVPLYRMFCQATGFGGTTQDARGGSTSITPTSKTAIVHGGRPITVRFNADVTINMPWSFTPEQSTVQVMPGETALAFYEAKNRTNEPIVGVATYNVQPPKVGVYFNKIQCFCFEEQRLNALEKVDMPVFFFIDPELVDDPRMNDVNEVVLSYTFFRAEDIDVDALANMASSVAA